MAPRKVAFIGLSAKAATVGWAAQAHLPYLQSEHGRARFEIVALVNTSEAAARAAVAAHGLPATTKAYGGSAALAADLAAGAVDVDTVVVSTLVDQHFSAIEPVLEAIGQRGGSAASSKTNPIVYVEWPLASTMADVQRLAALAASAGARAAGLRTAVGLQGRGLPALATLRGLLAEGRIGAVLSSELLANNLMPGMPWDGIAPNMAFTLDRARGGGVYDILTAHTLDAVASVLGPLDAAATTARFQVQRPVLHLVAADGVSHSGTTVPTDQPDLVHVLGALAGTGAAAANHKTAPGALFSYRLSRSPPFGGGVDFAAATPAGKASAFVWTITGETGQVRVECPIGAGFTAFGDRPRAGDGTRPAAENGPFAVTIAVHDFATDTVAMVPWAWAPWQEALPPPARNIGALYDAVADGREDGYVSFAQAEALHAQLGGWIKDWKA